MAAEIQSHLRRPGMSMPVSWALISSSGQERPQSPVTDMLVCPPAFWDRALRAPDCRTRVSFRFAGCRLQASSLGFCSLLSVSTCCPYCLGPSQFASAAALKLSLSHFLLPTSPVPRETLLLLNFSTWSLGVLILSGLAHAQFLCVLTLPEHLGFSLP